MIQFLHVLICSLYLWFLSAAKHSRDTIDNDIEGRNEEDAEGGCEEHTADDGDAHTVTRSSACAGCDGKRQTANDERK